MTTYQWIGLGFAFVGAITLVTLIWERSKRKTWEIDFLPVSGIMIWICRLMVGALFLYSGFVKANDYIGFAYKLEEYFTVFGTNFPAFKGFFDLFVPLAEPMAWFISVFEIALAVALILGWKMNLTAWLTMIMMIFFTVLTGYSHFTGSVTDCGCFGDALKIEPWESFTKDIFLTIMLIPIFLVRKSIRAVPNSKIAGWATAAVFIATGIFSYFCHETLPWIDYRAYKVGVDLKYCTTHIGPEGYPKCKDWYPYFPEGEIPLFEGNTLMIVMYDAEKAPDEAVEKSVSLTQSLQGENVKIAGLTASGPSTMETYIPDHKINFPIGYVDATVLKTVVRSHPGYVLLKDGIILKKWHYNNTPSAEEILGILGI